LPAASKRKLAGSMPGHRGENAADGPRMRRNV